MAVNAVGSSEFTASTSVALASLPDVAAAPVRLAGVSTESKIVLQWTAPTSYDTPGGDITGFRLWMDDGLGGDYEIIYDG